MLSNKKIRHNKKCLYASACHCLMAGVFATLSLSVSACSDTNNPLPGTAGKQGAAAMVFIPAGEFQMGANGPDANPDEKPVHPVSVSGFYIDRHEVTNAEYRRFVLASGHEPPQINASWAEPYNWTGSDYPPGTDNYPVVLVSWHDAAAYAAWARKRLPTEAEWEKAARGGLTGKHFPYGDRLELSQANYFKSYLRAKKLRPVGSFEPNAYGLHDMAGNVWEWCHDWYRPDYYSNGAGIDPSGPASGKYKIFRGGSWINDIKFLRCAQRGKNSPDHKSHTVGFRCARSADQSESRGGSEG